MKKRRDELPKPKPRPSLRERLKDQLEISDLEMTDLYNAEHGTSYPSPLRDSQVKEWCYATK